MNLKEEKSLKSQVDTISHSPEITLVAGSIKGAMKSAGAGSRDLWFVPRGQIRVIDGFNVRIKNQGYFDHIRYLADSMKTEGFKAEFPLSGYVARADGDSIIYITDGHCRLAGADLAIKEGAELELIPVVVASQSRDLSDLTVGLVRTACGKPLDALEKAAVCKRLVLFNWPEEQIAERLSFTLQYVRDLLTLIGSPIEVRNMVAQDKIAATTAIQMLNQHGDKAVSKIQEGLDRATASGKTKVTNRFIADPSIKFVKKVAPDLFTLVQEVKGDPAYDSLNETIRTKLDGLLTGIEQAKAKAVEKATGAAKQTA